VRLPHPDDTITLLRRGYPFIESHRGGEPLRRVRRPLDGTLKAAALCVACDMEYDVPTQDLSIPLSRMPTAPRSGFVIDSVRSAT
jgi:fatty-acid peroxygenase